MTLTVRLPTDLLWNKSNPQEAESYPAFVSQVGDEEIVEDQKKYQRTYNYKGEERLFATDRHQFVNMRGVEKRDDEYLLGGLCLFTRVGAGQYKLTDEGKELKRRYDSDDETAWESYIAELLGRHFVRARSILYYVGVFGHEYRYRGSQTFFGDELLQYGDASYVFHRTGLDQNGEFTLAGYAENLPGDTPDGLAEALRNAYKYEYHLLRGGLEGDENLARHIEETKQLLLQLNEEGPADHLFEAIFKSLDTLAGLAPKVSSPNKLFSRAPNLLIDANICDVIGPFLLDKIANYATDDTENVELTGGKGPEPLGGNIMLVVHRAMNFLLDRGILIEPENGRIVIDREATQVQCSGALVDNLFQAEFITGSELDLKDEIWDVYCEYRDPETGFVMWQDIKSEFVTDGEMSAGEFTDAIEQLLQSGELRIIDQQQGLSIDPDGPPGFTQYPYVILDIN